MIRVTVDNRTTELTDGWESWINQQVNRRKDDGLHPCIKVDIDAYPVRMILVTPGCPQGRGGRPPTEREKHIFDLWGKMGLNKQEFDGGNVVAFLKQALREFQ